ncbi:class I SAM-dependent methyltransferase [Pontibacter roseus]|uniref:class I SAM-dependent methyltransferase n=1 Tax=Pontibacter roseus TaxID=336989 RepID=UPI000374FA12|nr:class I SAM-dependent methyltransferase [Pontibacter roseus]
METHAILPKEISTRKIADFVKHVMADLHATENTNLTYVGSKLGLYKAMAYAGPLTAQDVALRSGAPLNTIEKWLESQAERHYIEYDPIMNTYTLPTEHAIAMTDSKSPFYIGGRFLSPKTIRPEKPENSLVATIHASNCSEEHEGLEDTSARFFNKEYITGLFQVWLPGIEGLTARLEAGIAVADLGCGRHGATTLMLAEAFPASDFYGFDNYESSVERASLLAKEKRISNAHFALATTEQVHAHQYDLITLIECVRNIGEMPELLRGCYEVLKPNGILVVVEAKQKDRVEEERYQRLRSAHAMPVGYQHEANFIEVGGDRSERELEAVARAAGFTYFNSVAETTLDNVYELRP